MQTRHRATHRVVTVEKLNICLLLEDLNENQLTYFARTSRKLTGRQRRQRGHLRVQLTFFMHFFPVTAHLQREVTPPDVSWRT